MASKRPAPPKQPAAAAARGIGPRPAQASAAPATKTAPAASGAPDAPGPAASSPGRRHTSTPRPPPRLQVDVVNGNLAYIAQPLFIGHYRALALSGAEKAVDDHIGGTMAQALALQAGHYPEQLNTHQAFINRRRDPERPQEMPKPHAVIVVGLGPEGELTEPGLTGTVRQAVIDWLQRHHEGDAAGAAPGAEVQIAATLIGSGGFGMSPGSSARAIVRAVQDANRRVAAVGWTPVTRLSLIELYMDRAADAWRELAFISGPAAEAAAAPFDLAPLIGQGSGGKPRPLDSSYRGADYDFVRISGRGEGRIEFALDTRRARSELRTQGTQPHLVQVLVRQAARDSAVDPRLGRTLFHLLVPPALEPYLGGKTRLMLDLSDSVAALPWELLDNGIGEPGATEDEPWALRVGLLRKLQTGSEPTAGRRDSVTGDRVLVIGDPALPPEAGLPPLPGARLEAEDVARLLGARAGDGDAAQPLMHLSRATGQDILNALYQHPWRVVHVAGHGHWSQGEGGLLLSTDGTSLGPAEVSAMRCVPELVFLNCCHLAQMEAGDPGTRRLMGQFAPGDLAAGVATALIRMGVRCVVAAGWAVDDAAARLFAQRFYQRLLTGATFGDAVTTARRATWLFERGPDGQVQGNTWAAYQCYGDPDWRLVQRTPAAAPRRDADVAARYAHIAHPAALVLALDSLATDVRWGRQPGAQAITDLRHLAGRFGGSLGTQGQVAEAFGLAFAEADDNPQALAWLERATQAADGSASFRALEALGNLLSRTAYDQTRDAGTATDTGARPSAQTQAKVLAQADHALQLLQANARARDTAMAHCLVGSAHKRRALVLQALQRPRDELAAALDAVTQGYEAGLARARALGGRMAYPLQNLAALDLRRALDPQDPAAADARAALPDRLARLQQAMADELQAHQADEWLHLGEIELVLQRALAEGTPVDETALLDRLDDLQGRIPGRKFWHSAWDQWDFILGHLPAAQRPRAAAAWLARLQRFAAPGAQPP